MADQLRQRSECQITLSRKATAFLVGLAQSLNTRETMPTGDAEMLETSAWLEEIEAQATAALKGA